MEQVVSSHDPGLDALRRLRAELRDSMAALEHALAAPAPGRQTAWAERVDVALLELSADFREHVAVTEGRDGVHRTVLETAPRLSKTVERLVAEHALIISLVSDLVTRVGPPMAEGDVDTVRELGTTLLSRLVRHRQHGADLIYQAYQVDLGGET